MHSKEEILDELKKVMEELFEVEPEKVELESQLYDDLELDSIDAVDLVIKLKELTGKMVNPEDFKNVRTVGHVVDVIHKLLQE